MAGKLLVFAAPSGSGKTTIVQNVLKEHKEFCFSVSATTRACRDYEKDGVHYFFISEDAFKQGIEAGNFIEWERFYDYYYGTLKSHVDSLLSDNKIVVFDIDVKGALSIKKHYPENSVLIFIKPPSVEELKRRLIARNTETESDLKKRFERIELELSYEDKFDKVVVNEVLEDAFKKVEEIIEEVI